MCVGVSVIGVRVHIFVCLWTVFVNRYFVRADAFFSITLLPGTKGNGWIYHTFVVHSQHLQWIRSQFCFNALEFEQSEFWVEIPICLSHLKMEFWSQMFVNGVPEQMFMNGVCVIPRCKDQLRLRRPRSLPQQCSKPRLQRPQIKVIRRRWRYLPQQCSRHTQKCKVRHS